MSGSSDKVGARPDEAMYDLAEARFCYGVVVGIPKL
jgi:hypothetical protein